MIVKGCPSATTNWIEPMRLTLRTLLAYLDDILEPNQAKEIGTKVSQSTFATGLTNRIREVMRRRRLTVPDTDGPNSGVDPNTVAEYLDNTLPSEAVADVEKVFLESDVNLAEVAASHQILTLVLGEPVDIPQESRERMYVLGPVTRKKSVSSEAAPAANQEATSGATNEVGNEPSKTVIPAYLLPTPMWRRAMPYTIAGLVAVIWFGLIVYDPTFNIFSGSSSDAVSNGTDNTDGLVAANDTNTSDAGNDSGTTGSFFRRTRWCPQACELRFLSRSLPNSRWAEIFVVSRSLVERRCNSCLPRRTQLWRWKSNAGGSSYIVRPRRAIRCWSASA
jgi:hypothetical protein